MANRRKFKSEAFEAIHSSVAAMYKIGTIDEDTMRSFDESCLVDPPSRKSVDSNESHNALFER